MAATIFPDNPSIGDRTFDQRYEWNGTKWVYLPPPQIPGDNGWTPVFAIETDDERRVLKVVDWLDGEGTKPNINVYVAVGGFTSVLADAVDIRGPAGVTGDVGLQGDKGDQGDPGVDGRGIDSITRTSGTGAPGTNDTYTILFTDTTSTTFVVHNGTDGVGSGDMSKSTYDTDGDGKVNAADTADSVPWAGVTGKGSKDLSTNDYTTAEKNKLAGIAIGATANSTDAILLDRANHTGTQAISTVTGLQTALDGKIASTEKGAANGVATLGSDQKLTASQVPAIAITDTYIVASQAAMLALAAQRGDVAVRSDLQKSFILSTESPTTLADWVELQTPTDAVLSVAGKTGVVSLVKGDVGLGNVDNTSDSNKPVSTAQQAALDLKVGGNAANNLGYLNIPQVSQSAAYTCVLTDAGKHLLHPSADTTARTFTIPANASVAFPVGSAITFINQNGGGVITIAITTDTMRLAGAGTTGSRTLAANGIATAIKVSSTEWLISGVNLT